MDASHARFATLRLICFRRLQFDRVASRGVDQGASGASIDAPGVGL